MDVGQVHLDRRHVHRRHRVPQDDARVCQPARVDDQPSNVRPACVQKIHDGTFRVRLEEFQFHPVPIACNVAQHRFDPGERRGAVDLRLSGPELVEVRTVDDQETGHFGPPSRRSERT
jgi:hypothetical protein